MTDPTLQATGALWSLLRLDWNGSSYASFAGIEYGPPNAPGTPWTQGTQYNGIATNTPVSPFGPQTGYAGIAQIVDMSPASVLPGKSYAVSVGLKFAFPTWIQLYFLLVGSTAGTTVLPGFGLWNLGSNPQAWTYATPTQFTGLWQIELLTGVSHVPVLLTVEYAAPKVYLAGTPPTAKLIFTVSGGTQTQGLDVNGWQPPEAQASSQPPDGSSPDPVQYINRSTPFIARGKAGEVLEGG